jgi:hypothetical protein
MARYTPPLPPPPPPPPSQPDVLEQLTKDISRFFESLHMPKVDTSLDLSAFKEQIQAMGANLGSIELPKLEQLSALKAQMATLDASILAKLDSVARGLETGLLKDYPSVQPLYEKVTAVMTPLLASHPSLTIALSTAISYQLVSQILSIGQAPPPAMPYPDGKYDPATARAYFDQRPLQVAARGLQIAVLSLQFGLGLLKDKIEYVLGAVCMNAMVSYCLKREENVHGNVCYFLSYAITVTCELHACPLSHVFFCTYFSYLTLSTNLQ